MKRAVLILTLALAACASPPPVVTKAVCPPVQKWSRADQLDLANALAPIPESSLIWRMQGEWQTLRDELKACAN